MDDIFFFFKYEMYFFINIYSDIVIDKHIKI